MQFKIDSERQFFFFFEKQLLAIFFIYSLSLFRNSVKRKSSKKYFSYFYLLEMSDRVSRLISQHTTY